MLQRTSTNKEVIFWQKDVYWSPFNHAPGYISDLHPPVADMPSRSSLRASSNGNLFLPQTERRFGDRAFSVAARRACNRLPTELKLMFIPCTIYDLRKGFFTLQVCAAMQ